MKMTTVTLMHTQLTEDQAMLSFSDLAPDVAGTGCICRVCGEEYNKDFSPVNIPRGSLVSQALPACFIKYWRWERPGNKATLRLV